MRRILHEAGVTDSAIEAVIRSAYQSRAEAYMINRFEEENKQLRNENESIKQKRKEDLAIIQRLRNELKEAELRAQAKPSTSKMRKGSKTSGKQISSLLNVDYEAMGYHLTMRQVSIVRQLRAALPRWQILSLSSIRKLRLTVKAPSLNVFRNNCTR